MPSRVLTCVSSAAAGERGDGVGDGRRVVLLPEMATAQHLYRHAGDTGGEYETHEPITQRLVGLLERGRHAGIFDRRLPTGWYVAAIIGLGHTAAQEATAGRMSTYDAGQAFTESVLRVCRTPPSR
jgi:hypothetical protein